MAAAAGYCRLLGLLYFSAVPQLPAAVPLSVPPASLPGGVRPVREPSRSAVKGGVGIKVPGSHFGTMLQAPDPTPLITWPTRFPTVVVGWCVTFGAVHLRSWAASHLGGYRLRSCLNGRERR